MDLDVSKNHDTIPRLGDHLTDLHTLCHELRTEVGSSPARDNRALKEYRDAVREYYLALRPMVSSQRLFTDLWEGNQTHYLEQRGKYVCPDGDEIVGVEELDFHDGVTEQLQYARLRETYVGLSALDTAWDDHSVPTRGAMAGEQRSALSSRKTARFGGTVSLDTLDSAVELLDEALRRLDIIE